MNKMYKLNVPSGIPTTNKKGLKAVRYLTQEVDAPGLEERLRQARLKSDRE